MILAVGNIKGGVSKTTLAINLAIALSREDSDVLLIDGDELATAMAFTSLRTSARNGRGPGYTAVALHGANLRTQARQMAAKYSDIVIDVGGRDTGSLRAALTVADIVLVPLEAPQLRPLGSRADPQSPGNQPRTAGLCRHQRSGPAELPHGRRQPSSRLGN
jgi:cellulose biosynthesis protein BcsQ